MSKHFCTSVLSNVPLFRNYVLPFLPVYFKHCFPLLKFFSAAKFLGLSCQFVCVGKRRTSPFLLPVFMYQANPQESFLALHIFCITYMEELLTPSLSLSITYSHIVYVIDMIRKILSQNLLHDMP